ncbi:nuclear transport factor 2 family protein [Bizionia arctica]|uniref:Nuclear transport factor 2 family protein n=1 Tax=Bizionia arctica TaxID=1495645 RepID=A0A917GE98_9FLAO|nr:hypothetical protein [Bizionia arctica]GGG40515.1 hypothetical protein GCM10010976_10180 [Bizionia arctica]
MKHLKFRFSPLCLFLISILFLGCSEGKTSSDSQKNIDLVNKYVQAVEALDYEGMGSLLDENYIGIGPSIGDSINKSNALINWEKNATTLYQSIKYKKSRTFSVSVTDGDQPGNWVSNWAEVAITYQGDKGSVDLLANTIYKIENDKIVESYTFYNEADALEQLGYVFINVNNL